MNTKYYYLIVAFLATAATFAQAPEKMSYQAVVRAADNTLVTNQKIGMQISILETTLNGDAVYIETHTPTTNANGLVTIEIGTGNPTLAVFSAIDWAAGSFFTKTQIDPTGGANYTITGTSELLSVPYALYAKTAGTSAPAGLNDLSDVSLENNSMYIGTKPAAAVDDPRWNLAIGNDALQSNTSGSTNTAVGPYTLSTNTSGIENTAIGSSVLKNNIGSRNTASGNYALYENTSGSNNTASGAGGLRDNTSGSRNTASGYDALAENTTGSDNTAIGYNADVIARDLNNATAIGANAVVSASNTIQLGDTNVIDVITSGNITASGFTTSAGATLHVQSSGMNAGDMQYWNGTSWEVVEAPSGEDAVLKMKEGIPTWVEPATIGDLRAGGIVFWVDPSDNTKGLVCALEDASDKQWMSDRFWQSDHTNLNTDTAIGTGAANTDEAIRRIHSSDVYSAKKARQYRGGGYTDWFLPSRDALRLIWLNVDQADQSTLDPSFKQFRRQWYDSYASSSQKSRIEIWSINFSSDGGGEYRWDSKRVTRRVRSARAF
jgi:hypothetical protein